MSGIRIRSFPPGQAFQWVSCGLRFIRRRPADALMPAAAFALSVLLLFQVPVLGNVVLLLFLPTLLASYLLQVHLLALTGNRSRAGMGGPAYRRWTRELRQSLFGAWMKPENIFPLILVGILLVVVGLLAMFLFSAVGGQGVMTLNSFFELTPLQMGRVVLAYGAVAFLWSVVAGAILWSLPMFVIRNMVLGEAMRWGWRGFFRNAGAAITFGLVLSTVLLPGALAKPWLPLGYHVIAWLALTLFTALAGFSAYCSYRLVFADAEPGARSPSSHPPAGRGAPPAPPRPVARRG